MLADPDTDVWVAAASAWEIATKVRIGKMPGAEHLVVDFGEYLRRWYASELGVEAADALHAGVMEWGHRDPFDRMLAAQAPACRPSLRHRRKSPDLPTCTV